MQKDGGVQMTASNSTNITSANIKLTTTVNVAPIQRSPIIEILPTVIAAAADAGSKGELVN